MGIPAAQYLLAIDARTIIGDHVPLIGGVGALAVYR